MLKRILTFFGYFGVTALIIGVTSALVAYGSGYGFDFSTGKVYRTGLVILQSQPSGLTIIQDGKQLKKKTPTRISLKVGNYTFQLNRDGYRSWSKSLQVIASEVTMAQYVYLIPNKPATRTVTQLPAGVIQGVSQDHRKLAYIVPGDTGGVYVLDLTNDDAAPTKLYTPAAATPTVAAESLTELQWSEDGQRLLIGSRIGDRPTYRLSDPSRADSAPTDLTTQYGFDLTGIKFAPGANDRFYWLTEGGLRRLDTGSQSVSGVLADKVNQFEVAGGRVLYVQTTDLGRSIWSLDRNANKRELVQALPESPSYSIDFARYDNEDHVSVVPSATGIGTLYSGVDGDAPTSKTLAKEVTTTMFSADAHLLVFRSTKNVTTYDLERSNVDNTTVLYQFPTADGEITDMTWFDNFHLLMTRGGHTVWTEFDGANQVDLGESALLPAYNANDNRSVYSFQADGEQIKLTETTLRP